MVAFVGKLMSLNGDFILSRASNGPAHSYPRPGPTAQWAVGRAKLKPQTKSFAVHFCFSSDRCVEAGASNAARRFRLFPRP